MTSHICCADEHLSRRSDLAKSLIDRFVMIVLQSFIIQIPPINSRGAHVIIMVAFIDSDSSVDQDCEQIY